VLQHAGVAPPLKIPSYANLLRQGCGGQEASEGYPPVAKSTEASSFEHMNNSAAFYAFFHPAERDGLLRRWITLKNGLGGDRERIY